MNSIVSGILGNTLRRYLVIALAASLAVTGGMFAYAYTTTNVSMTVTGATQDFAALTGNSTGAPTFTAFGTYRGAIPAGYIFDVTPDSNYGGDVGVNVYLDNADQIGYKYSMFLLRLNLVDYSDNGSMDKDALGNGAGDRVLTMNNGVVSFVSDNMVAGTTYHIMIKGGVYRTYPWSFLDGIGGSWNPSFTAEVFQAGL
ncbi:MAG: hypothetical protein V3W44_01105 [Dehalococcoidales bacterium]